MNREKIINGIGIPSVALMAVGGGAAVGAVVVFLLAQLFAIGLGLSDGETVWPWLLARVVPLGMGVFLVGGIGVVVAGVLDRKR